MLVSLKRVLEKAERGRYAVGAFNVNNLEMIHAVLAAAEAERSPVILQTSEGAIAYAGMEELGTIVHIAAERTRIPVVFHLDHGKHPKIVEEAIKSGYYTSVMFDGSSLPYEENIRITKHLTKMAHAKNISLEAELGTIAGIEDFVSVKERDAHFTNPEQAERFVKQTGCDALAVAIGTRHGAFKFKGASRMDFNRLLAIKLATDIPLVLHGASGVPAAIKKQCQKYGCKINKAKGVSDTNIKKAVEFGINKVNIDTDLRIAFDAGIRQFLAQHPEEIDPREILKPAKELMTSVARQKMKLFGSSGKA